MLSKWGQRFSPLSLFAAGEQGGWWDPSDFGTMFQDSAGTTPVTAVGQPVGLIRDKSGRGNHLLQGTTASRPLLTQDATGFYLLHDGVDDGLATAGNVNFSATDKLTLVAGARKESDAAVSVLCELSANAGVTPGTFNITAPSAAATANYAARSGGTTSVVATATGFAAPVANVLTSLADVAGSSLILRANGAQVAQAVVSQGTGNFASAQLFVGRRGGATNPFTGRIYNLIIRGATSSAAQIALAERFVGSKMGIVL